MSTPGRTKLTPPLFFLGQSLRMTTHTELQQSLSVQPTQLVSRASGCISEPARLHPLLRASVDEILIDIRPPWDCLDRPCREQLTGRGYCTHRSNAGSVARQGQQLQVSRPLLIRLTGSAGTGLRRWWFTRQGKEVLD